MWANSEMGKHFQQTGRSGARWGWCFQHCVCLCACTCLRAGGLCAFLSTQLYVCLCMGVCAHGYAPVCACMSACVCFCVSLCMGLFLHVVDASSTCVCVHTYGSASAELSQLWAPPVAWRARAEARPEHPVLSSTHSGLTCPAHLPLSSSSPSSYRSSPGTRWEQHRHRR